MREHAKILAYSYQSMQSSRSGSFNPFLFSSLSPCKMKQLSHFEKRTSKKEISFSLSPKNNTLALFVVLCYSVVTLVHPYTTEGNWAG